MIKVIKLKDDGNILKLKNKLKNKSNMTLKIILQLDPKKTDQNNHIKYKIKKFKHNLQNVNTK
jgi:hypothetical protein